jgi:hypothetical protein
MTDTFDYYVYAYLREDGTLQYILLCLYCEKSGGSANMKRYHMDNCKLKEKVVG